MFFAFPENARWNEALNAVEFGVEIGEYAGVVRVRRRVFQHLFTDRLTPEKCVESYHLHRTRFERIAERKRHCRQLSDDGNVEIECRPRGVIRPAPGRSADSRWRKNRRALMP